MNWTAGFSAPRRESEDGRQQDVETDRCGSGNNEGAEAGCPAPSLQFSPKKRARQGTPGAAGLVVDIRRYSEDAALVVDGFENTVCVQLNVTFTGRPSPLFQASKRIEEYLQSGSLPDFPASVADLAAEAEQLFFFNTVWDRSVPFCLCEELRRTR